MYYLLLFSLAVLSVSFFPTLPAWWMLIVIFLAGLFLAYWRYRIVAVVLLGVLIGCMLGQYQLRQQLPIEWEQQAITIIGNVIDIPRISTNKQRFDFYVNQSQELSFLYKKRLVLSWYRSSLDQSVATGQCWQLTVVLRRPRGFLNPAGFDYQAYLLRQGVYASGYVKASPQAQLLEATDSRCQSQSIGQLVDNIRWNILQRLDKHIVTAAAKGPLLALLVGDTQWITPDQWTLLRNTGTVHLLAISGLHIGLSAVIGFYSGLLLMKLLFVSSPTILWQRIFPPCFSIAMATAYALLAGMSLPTQRALIMVCLLYVGVLLCRRFAVIGIFAASLSGIALTDPLAMTSAGFWLSFLAVAILLYGFQGRQSPARPIWQRYSQDLLKTQWLLLPGLAIVSMIWLQGLSVSGSLANLWAVTLVSLCIVPVLFLLLAVWLLSLPGANTLLWLLEQLTELLWWGLEGVDQYAPAFWFLSAPEPTWYSILLCAVGVLWLLGPKGLPYRYLGVIGFLPVLFAVRPATPLGVTFLEVGQGTAVVVNTAQHTLVYDTGPRYSQRFNAGQHIIAPYLRSKGVQSVDALMVSHSDYDHAGGMLGLLNTLSVETLLSGQAAVINQRLQHTNIALPKANRCEAGKTWQWDGVVFTILWPLDHDAFPSLSFSPILSPLNNNNHSCVLLIEYQGRKVLLAGDIERRVEAWLLKHYAQQLASIDILLIPHHGSQTSSSFAWVNTTRPDWSVVSAGYRNRYRHPHANVVSRYHQVGSKVLNTAQTGALRFTLRPKAKQWQLEQWRRDYRRYWH